MCLGTYINAVFFVVFSDNTVRVLLYIRDDRIKEQACFST